MEKDPIDEHAAREAQPAEAERNYGILAAGVIALMCWNGDLLGFVKGFRKGWGANPVPG
jgi:hypothetical protein